MSLGEDVQRAAKRVAELTEMCLRAELAEAKARIAELEEALHVTLDEREEEMARAERVEAELVATRENYRRRRADMADRGLALERAEARIAELEAELSRDGDQIV